MPLSGYAKRRYVQFARTIDRLLSSRGLLEATPTESRLLGWLRSLPKIYDSTSLAAMDVPWWTYRSIDAIEMWIASSSQPIRAFEFGSGASTIWLSRRCEHVDTVEHDASFYQGFLPSLAGLTNVNAHLVEPDMNPRPLCPSRKPGFEGLDFQSYVSTIASVGGDFELIVIDGRARVACLRASIPHLAPGGVIVFDNSLRWRYRRGITSSGLSEKRFLGLAPTLPYPDQTSLLWRANAQFAS